MLFILENDSHYIQDFFKSAVLLIHLPDESSTHQAIKLSSYQAIKLSSKIECLLKL
jgi:hypothetical protein